MVHFRKVCVCVCTVCLCDSVRANKRRIDLKTMHVYRPTLLYPYFLYYSIVLYIAYYTIALCIIASYILYDLVTHMIL